MTAPTRTPRNGDEMRSNQSGWPRTAALIASFAVAITLIASCSSGGSSPKATLKHVRVMLDWTPNTNHAGMYLAKAKGYYKAQGLDVTFLQPGQGTDPNQAVGAGTVQFGISAAEQLIPARAEGVPIVSVAAIIQHNTSSLVSLKSSKINRPRDLAGHTYGAFGGTFEKELLDTLVACDGGDPTKVHFTEVGDSDYRQGLTSGHFNAVWIFDGWDGIRLSAIDKLAVNRIRFSDYERCIPDWYTPIIVTNEKSIKTDPDLVRKFMTATAHGYRDAMAQPAVATRALLAAAPGLDADLVARSMTYLSTHYASDPSMWGHQDAKVWERFVKFLEDHKLVKPGFDASAAFTNEFLPSSK